MNKSTRKITPPKTTATHKGGKAYSPIDPRDSHRAPEILTVEELGVYTSSHQVDPWRGQLVQLSWDYCV